MGVGLGSALASFFGFSGGLTLGSGGGVLSVAALTSFLATFAFASSSGSGLGMSIFSTSAFGFFFSGAFLMPLVIFVKSLALMKLTGIASIFGASTARPE